MNFLAHLYLSAPDKSLMRGGFLGDFVKGQLCGQFPGPLERGIRLHRHIDSRTDQHPLQKSIRQKLPPRFSRYSGIITDMMCDHFLSRHWSNFHEDTLPEFNQESIAAISAGKQELTDKARFVLRRLDQENWLLSYDNLDYVSGALSRIGQRMRYANPLGECQGLLPSICDKIEADCLEILNDTRDAVTKWRAANLMEINQ